MLYITTDLQSAALNRSATLEKLKKMLRTGFEPIILDYKTSVIPFYYPI